MAQPAAGTARYDRVEVVQQQQRNNDPLGGPLQIQRLVTAAAVGLTLASLALAGCKNDPNDPNNPDNPNSPNALGLAVAVRVDPATFPTTGEFALELLPTTKDGQVLNTETWTISSTVDAPAGAAVSLLSQGLEPADGRPFNVALDIDNSSSMNANDPDRLRASAADDFWQAIFGQNAASKSTLLNFGLGGKPATPGFSKTRMLAGWTSDRTQLVGILDTLTIGASSPLYTSATEVVKWIDSTTPRDAVRRALVILSDGQPSDGEARDGAIQAALGAGVTIYTVGVGAGSDRGTQTKPTAVAVLQQLASATGGLYAGAATADRLSSIFQSFASSATTGKLVAHFKLAAVPAPGTTVSGVVKLKNNRGTAQASWSFVAP